MYCFTHLSQPFATTDPPKVAADVVESVIGAVYMDSGFASGISAVGRVLSPLLPVLEKLYAKNSKLIMMHPKKAMQEMAGSLLAVKVMREEDFASQHPKTSVWLGRRWGKASLDGHGKFVGSVDCLGFNAVSVLDSSSEVAGNRACALAVAMLKKYPKLLSRVQEGRTLVESSSSREEKQKAKTRDQSLLDSSSTDMDGSMDIEEGSPKGGEAATKTNTGSDKAETVTIDNMHTEGKEALLKSVVKHVLEWL